MAVWGILNPSIGYLTECHPTFVFYKPPIILSADMMSVRHGLFREKEKSLTTELNKFLSKKFCDGK